MRILIAGCHRSGTTALFNIVRLICEAHGNTYACFDDTYNEIIGGEFDFEIVKVHRWYKDEKWLRWADKIMTIEREPWDIWESMQRFARTGGRKLSFAEFGKGLIHWGKYHKHDDYAAHFDQLSRSTEKLAKQISDVIGLEINEKAIVKQFREIKPPKSGYDPVTLLHSNHITQK